MNISELKNHIKTNSFYPMYVFYGEEWKVQELYLEQMTKVIGNKVYCDSVSEIIPKLQNRLFANSRTLYVVREDREFMLNESLVAKVKKLLRDNVLVLLVFSADKRMKFYKMNCDSFVEFSLLEHAVLKRYVKREIALSDRNIDRLIQVCEGNYGRILLEIDKIKNFDSDVNEVFEKFLLEGTIYEPPYDAVFDFVDETVKGHVNSVYDLLEQCYEIGEATLVMISVLYNTTKQILQVQSCQSDDIAKTTGLSNWQIKKAKEKVGYRTVSELVYMLKLIQKVEKGIKTGKIDEEFAMQYILANVL